MKSLSLFILIFAAGAFLRFFALNHLPLGFHYDEGLDAVSAHEIWSKGVHPIFFPQSGSREPLMIYLESLGILALGPTRLGARIAQACVGTATIGVAWLLFKDMYGRRVALLGSAFLAVSFWQLFESRLGLRAISQPLVEGLALLFLWRAFAGRRWPDALLAGAFFGLALYTYTAARALPLLAVLLVGWQALASPAFVRKQWRHMLGAAATALAVFAPLGWYAIHNWNDFFGRSVQVNLIAPEEFTGAAQAGGVGAAIWRTLGMFSVRGDPAWKYNIGGQPVFDWPVSALFYAGIVLAVIGVARYVRQPRRQRALANPDVFALLTVIVMLLPGMLSAEAPHFLRTIGVAPLLFVFPALGLSGAMTLLAHWGWAGPAAAGLLLAGEGAETGYHYFVQWAQAPQAYYAMQADVSDAAAALEDQPSRTPILFSTEYPGHPALLYLFPKLFGRIRWFDGRQSLAFPPAGQPALYAFTTPYQPLFTSLGQLFPGTAPLAQGRDPGGHAAWTIYGTSQPPALTPAKAVPATIGGIARFDGFTAAGSVQAGQALDVQELWHTLGPGSADVRAFLHLVDAQGNQWAQADNLGFYAEDWRPGDQALNDQHLAVPAYAPPVAMQLQFGLYDAVTGRRLPVQGGAGDHLTLGTVQVQPAPAATAGWVPPHALAAAVAPGLTLAGYDVPNPTAQAGGTLEVDLYWRITGRPASVPAVQLSLPGQSASASAHPHPGPLPEGEGVRQTGLADLLPPEQWPVGDVIEDRRQLTLAPTLRAGTATLTIAGVSLGQVRVTEPARSYALPAIQHPLAVPVGGFARLAGYDLSPVQPGGPLDVTLVWQATGTAPASYKGFVHVLDGQDHVLTQQDQVPQAGAMPTSFWLPGQVIADVYHLTLPAQLPPAAQLEIGLYEPATGQRVPIGGADHLVLPLSR